MPDLHPKVLALIEAGKIESAPYADGQVDIETDEEFARRIALRQHEIDERENAALRAEIDRHHEVGRELCTELSDLRAQLEAAQMDAGRGDPMENWLMKPALEWLEQAEHGHDNERCKMIADLLRDLWRGNANGTVVGDAAIAKEGK